MIVVALNNIVPDRSRACRRKGREEGVFENTPSSAGYISSLIYFYGLSRFST
jgi:hypothetical protein